MPAKDTLSPQKIRVLVDCRGQCQQGEIAGHIAKQRRKHHQEQVQEILSNKTRTIELNEADRLRVANDILPQKSEFSGPDLF